MRVATFAEIEDEFIARAHKMVWCNVATVDAADHPHSRILHSVWEGSTGWIATRRHSPKARELEQNPHVSLAYIADVVRPVYADCLARWEDDLALKRHVWDLVLAAPPPLGYDPAPIFGSVDAPDFGLLRLTPYAIELGDVSGQGERRIVWRAKTAEEAV
jgi:general stress protein 26